jgi:hypothetical protein
MQQQEVAIRHSTVSQTDSAGVVDTVVIAQHPG